jgi:hypothetical protein
MITMRRPANRTMPKRDAGKGPRSKQPTMPNYTAPTPKARRLKLATKDPRKGGKADQRPFLREELDRGGGSPVGP